MDVVKPLLFLAGLVALGVVFVVAERRSQRRRADDRLRALAATVPAPLTPEVEAWLRPQLDRRNLYPAVGGTVGLLVANVPLPGWTEVPWYWFAVLVGTSAGALVGTLAAGYRAVPLVDGPTRVADPVRRRVADHVGPVGALQLRLSLAIAAASLAVAVATALGSGSALATRAVVACAVGAVVVVASDRVSAAVAARPMVASTAEGRAWHLALLAVTLRPVPLSAYAVSVFAAVLAVVAVVEDRVTLGVPTQVAAVALAVLATASLLAVGLTHRRAEQRSTAAARPATATS
jgi:hypothetical protein